MFTDFAGEGEHGTAIIPLPFVIRDRLLWFVNKPLEVPVWDWALRETVMFSHRFFYLPNAG